MKKMLSRQSLLVCLFMVFMMLFSTMAWAAETGSTGTKCPLQKVTSQTVSVDQFQKWLSSGSCSKNTTNTNCVGKSCANLCLTISGTCQNPWSCFQTGTAKTTNSTSTCPKVNTGTSSKPAPAPQPTPKPTPAPDPTPAPSPAPTSGLTADEQKMVDLVNAERTKAGLSALKVDMSLVKTARMKSQDMIDKGYFNHNSPTYGSPFDLMKSQGITYRTAGENLAGNSTVEKAHTALMNSAGHRANILNKNFTSIGIGIINGGPYGKMFTQHFTG